MAERGRSQRGATIVEFALILPIFAMLVLGLFTGGLAYFRQITVTDAVREGARYAATLEGAMDDKATWQQAVRERVAHQSGGEIPADEVCVDITSDPANLSCGVATPDDAQGQVVKVGASKDVRIDWLLGATDVTLRGRAAAHYERQ